jgi:hypothetical protein
VSREEDEATTRSAAAAPRVTPRDVLCALVEAYRQAAQDAIHATLGESWPTHREREAAELEALHGRCAAWVRRFDAAAAQAPGQTAAPEGVPVTTLRALLAELDAWPARATNFGDACDRLSDMLAACGGEEPAPATEPAESASPLGAGGGTRTRSRRARRAGSASQRRPVSRVRGRAAVSRAHRRAARWSCSRARASSRSRRRRRTARAVTPRRAVSSGTAAGPSAYR